MSKLAEIGKVVKDAIVTKYGVWQYSLTNEFDREHYIDLVNICDNRPAIRELIFGWPYQWTDNYNLTIDNIITSALISNQVELVRSNQTDFGKTVVLACHNYVFVIEFDNFLRSTSNIRIVACDTYDNFKAKGDQWTINDGEPLCRPTISRYGTILLWDRYGC